jgi:hypothetical protein
MAALEAQVQKTKKTTRQADATQESPPGLHLFLLIFTYRLSSRKPTRSPPTLVHRVKLDLRKCEGPFDVRRIPFTFNWSAQHLYVTRSAAVLDILRIPLFKDLSSSGEVVPAKVLVPRNRIFLPETSALRLVHFVPAPEGSDGKDFVIVESETRTRENTIAKRSKYDVETDFARLIKVNLLPAVGAFLGSQDTGDWVDSQEVVVPQARYVGKLDRHREKFNPIDDCVGTS